MSPAYNYGAVIAYNTARKPGLGSAIFLHVSHGSATAGCVAVPQSDVLKLLRWLNPKLGPRIIMGTTGGGLPALRRAAFTGWSANTIELRRSTSACLCHRAPELRSRECFHPPRSKPNR